MTPQDIAYEIYDALVNVTDNVYDEILPKSLPNHSEFVVFVVRSFEPMSDFDISSGYSARVFVECYVKNKANGIKNTARAKDLIDLVTTAVNGINTMRASLSNMSPQSKQINDYYAQVLVFNIIKTN